MRHQGPSSKWFFAALFLLLGCQPEIGDACKLHSDCSASGDRLCDPTFEGGYCTVFNCEPGTCPEESVCVAYQTAPSSQPECRDTQAGTRFARTFCMKSCGSRGDCRTGDGYSCVDLSEPNAWGAVVVERGSAKQKVCAVALSAEGSEPSGETNVCAPSSDASFPDAEVPPLPVEAGSSEAGPDASGDSGLDARPDSGADGSVDGASPVEAGSGSGGTGSGGAAPTTGGRDSGISDAQGQG